MAVVTNFSQLAVDQQMYLRERMRALCPQTADLADHLSLRPVQTPEAFRSVYGPSDLREQYWSDSLNAENINHLTSTLKQACALEMLSPQLAALPPFLQGHP